MKTADFDFDLPQELIATEPVTPRDASRMLVVDAENKFHDDFTLGLANYLRDGDLLVLNNTKVIPASLIGKRGEVNIQINLLRRLDEHTGGWEVLAKPMKRLHIGDKIEFSSMLWAIVEEKAEDGTLRLIFNTNELESHLYVLGKMPLPPYMKRKAQQADMDNYQTVFAQRPGAVAAPTAGLHFTDKLFDFIQKKGVSTAFITLHVGAGTFQPVKTTNLHEHKMHSEYAEITRDVAKLINKHKQAGGRIIAVGTTSLRTLESAATEDGAVQAINRETNIFITPGFKFRAVDALLTNFHTPRSTLFALVCAFKGMEVMRSAYRHAIGQKYRFYSYGDACLLIR